MRACHKELDEYEHTAKDTFENGRQYFPVQYENYKHSNVGQMKAEVTEVKGADDERQPNVCDVKAEETKATGSNQELDRKKRNKKSSYPDDLEAKQI